MIYRALREAAYAANMAIRDAGLVVMTWGNASAADRALGVFAIKPSGVAYADLRPEAMVIVSIETGEVVAGELRPSSDTATHQRLYAAFAGIGGVVHSHSPAATSFAQACRPIPCLGTTHADHFAGPVPVTRHPTAPEIARGYESATGDIIVEHFTSREIDPLAIPAVLLPHHGPFAWGSTAEKAAHNAIALEAVAAMAITTFAAAGADLRTIGDPTVAGPPPDIPAVLREKHFSRKHGPDAYYGQPG